MSLQSGFRTFSLNLAHQTGSITAVTVLGYLDSLSGSETSRCCFYKTRSFYIQGWHQVFTAPAHNRREAYQTAQSCPETPPHLMATESNTGGQLFIGWSQPFEVAFQTQRPFQDLPPYCLTIFTGCLLTDNPQYRIWQLQTLEGLVLACEKLQTSQDCSFLLLISLGYFRSEYMANLRQEIKKFVFYLALPNILG